MSDSAVSKTKAAGDFARLRSHLRSKIVGQDALIDKLIIAMLADGHLLVEGAPGLAKTKAIKTLASSVECDEHRIQFTPDLLPADITGSDIYNSEQGKFIFQKGPIFHNLILADEINRAPAKVQSALLEAMAERQITVGAKTYKLPDLFLVMATQNPIEQEGTYNLPEAQLDRFLMYIRISHPSIEAERQILNLVRNEQLRVEPAPFEKISQETVFQARQEVLNMHLSPALQEYIVQFIMATRKPQLYGDKLAKLISFGASPRGTIALDRCARARAWLMGREFAGPEDVHEVIRDVLRHRIILSFEGEAEGYTTDSFIELLLTKVPLP
ncbi:MAG: AAA family ATPase [Alphaproteobacteria bacterium]|nr:AAA family ATPase [Alphaproteobacteria bacterium]